jgi:chromosome segregation ATPase
MSPEGNIQDEVSRLRDEVSDLKATTRVTKHDVGNLGAKVDFIYTRFDKLEEQIKGELKNARDEFSREMRAITEKIVSETKILSGEISNINTRQDRTAGFYAGVVAAASFSIGIIGALLMLLYQQLFGGQS